MTPRSERDPAATLLLAFGIGLLTLYAGASADASNWTWGLNLGHYYPVRATWLAALTGLGLLLFGWVYAEIAPAASVAGASASRGKPRSPGGLVWALAGLAALPLLWILRERIHFLGDT